MLASDDLDLRNTPDSVGVRAPKFVLGAVAYNQHVQNMGRALHEHGALSVYASSGVDVFRNPIRLARRAVRAIVPRLDRELKRRAVVGLPPSLVRARWRWEGPRVIASRLGLDDRLVDWLWDHEEFDFDRACARLVADEEIGAFLGVEYGALESLRTAKRLGKPAVLALLSPHYKTFERWVETEYERFPELVTSSRAYFESRVSPRRERRDQEAALADWIVTNSTFTTRSLVDAGFDANKILTVPLGGPTPIGEAALPRTRPDAVRFAYVGPVSIRKGAHYLLRAWRLARPPGELHFYGEMRLPERLWKDALLGEGGDSIVFHGSVPYHELTRAYLESSTLVLPTLCDGFGLVVSEALAHGLPVITTRNAGAAAALEHGRTGFVLSPADPEALAAVITWCTDHPEDLFAMRRAALAASARWTWADFRRSFAELVLTAVSA
jgi:glycosyltransferase involved in cell wall biosynthesis